jgi:Domain of unknown function (DUF4258)
MGDRIALHQMTNVQLQTYIRRLAQDSSRVFFPDHARLRMLERGVSDMAVLMCLREGLIQRPAKLDHKTGELRARMEHFGSARNLSVVVALDDHDPDLLVVTVITRVR